MTLNNVTANATVQITDVNGKLMADYQAAAIGDIQIRVNVNNWSQGVYFVTLRNGDNLVTKKLVVTK